MNNQDHKVIFITGSSSGLGRATAIICIEGVESHRLDARPK
jgi:NADP-dependent 3-hydroxy acid dehydrogenase YdfG